MSATLVTGYFLFHLKLFSQITQILFVTLLLLNIIILIMKTIINYAIYINFILNLSNYFQSTVSEYIFYSN